MYVLYRFIMFYSVLLPNQQKKQKKTKVLGSALSFQSFKNPSFSRKKALVDRVGGRIGTQSRTRKPKFCPIRMIKSGRINSSTSKLKLRGGTCCLSSFAPLTLLTQEKQAILKHQTAESKRHQTGPSKAVSHSNPRSEKQHPTGNCQINPNHDTKTAAEIHFETSPSQQWHGWGENGEGPSKSIVSVPRFAVKPMFRKPGMIPKLQESHGLSQTLPWYPSLRGDNQLAVFAGNVGQISLPALFRKWDPYKAHRCGYAQARCLTISAGSEWEDSEEGAHIKGGGRKNSSTQISTQNCWGTKAD